MLHRLISKLHLRNSLKKLIQIVKILIKMINIKIKAIMLLLIFNQV